MNKHIPSLFRVIRSTYEPSTNFLFNYGKGVIEARYVRKQGRQPFSDPYKNYTSEPTKIASDYLAAYVSSHNGCKMGCRFCFLTQNEDTTMQHVDIETYLLQLKTVLDHYRQVVESGLELPVERCNINFMSKGEALANKYVVYQYPKLYKDMKSLCQEYGLEIKPNVSTIMPTVVRDRQLSDIFEEAPVNLYYSLYSINPTFRAKWLPNALPYDIALNKLKIFQETRNNAGITFHWALIKNHNDYVEEAKEIAKILKAYQFNAKLNIVRFNPHPNLSDTEADPERIDEIFNIISSVLNNPKSYIVPRLDVKTSAPCGMFESPIVTGHPKILISD